MIKIEIQIIFLWHKKKYAVKCPLYVNRCIVISICKCIFPVLLGCRTTKVNQTSNGNKESLANTANTNGTDDQQMMQTITKNVSEMVIGELQKLGMFPTTVVNTSSRGCTDSLPEETTRRLTACSKYSWKVPSKIPSI